ncbi:MAG TPA: sugar phosphate nucleotidyltransferase [Bacillota bacterium]|nr:sugar phosphate nucleotidyltransferase [Bacillota bacterium]
MRAVFLAAGEGKRLRPYFNRPKPLVPLLGLSLIERNILSLRECGIKEFVVITGCYADAIEEYLGNGDKLGVEIKYLHNERWALGNGVTAYTFHQEYRPGEKFILMMSDHIFGLDLLKNFIAAAQKIKEDEILIAADRRLEKVYDLDECTKIKAERDYALKLGKKLGDFNAVDCGLFIATGALLDALSQAISRGDYTLTDGVNILAGSGRAKLHFVNDFWVDVDDQAGYRHCEKMLLQSLVPAKDGFISHHLNRRFSLRITRYLARTGITPNQVTVISFLIAVAAAFCFALGKNICGGLLAQLSSIIDGVDGEIARLKFQKSNYGGFIDSILDRYADFLIVIGITYAWYTVKTNSPVVLMVAAAALTGMPMSMLFKEKYHALTGKPFLPEQYDGIFRYLPANRDGRLFVIMWGGIFNLLPAALVILAVAAHCQTFIRLYQARRMV